MKNKKNRGALHLDFFMYKPTCKLQINRRAGHSLGDTVGIFDYNSGCKPSALHKFSKPCLGSREFILYYELILTLKVCYNFLENMNGMWNGGIYNVSHFIQRRYLCFLSAWRIF